MDLNLLPMFVAVADALSFSVASKRLDLRPSSVSRGIAALERELGVQLFNRTTRRTTLTPAGLALQSRLTGKLEALRGALGELPEQEEAPSGELIVSAANDVGSILLPPVIASFVARYPKVRVSVRISNAYVDLLKERVDVALRIGSGRLRDSSLVARKICEIDAFIVASPTYLARAGGAPRTPEESARHDWLAMNSANAKSIGAPADRVRVTADDMLFLRGAVVAGLGLTMLPAFLAREDLEAGRLVRVMGRTNLPAVALHFVHAPQKRVPPKITAFRDHLVQHLARS